MFSWLFSRRSPEDVYVDFYTMLQRRLRAHGYWDGDVDGEWSHDLSDAVRAFKGDVGLRDDRMDVGRRTLDALLADPRPDKTVPVHVEGGFTPRWVPIALGEVGVTETPGPGNTPRVVRYHASTGLGPSDDSVPWCGSFVAWVFQQVGIPYRRATAAQARDWLRWGKKIPGPCLGAVRVDWRGDPSGWQGHVSVVVGRSPEGDVVAVSGNKGDRVSVDRYDNRRLLGYVYPLNERMPPVGMAHLPFVDDAGAPGAREA